MRVLMMVMMEMRVLVEVVVVFMAGMLTMVMVKLIVLLETVVVNGCDGVILLVKMIVDVELWDKHAMYW